MDFHKRDLIITVLKMLFCHITLLKYDSFFKFIFSLLPFCYFSFFYYFVFVFILFLFCFHFTYFHFLVFLIVSFLFFFHFILFFISFSFNFISVITGNKHTHAEQQNVRSNDAKNHVSYMSYMWHMKNHETSITFHPKIWHLIYLHLKWPPRKLLFYTVLFE